LPYERFIFNRRDQLEGESFDSFLAALRTLVKTCNFCDNCIDSLLRDRIILGIKDPQAQKNLLKERDLTLANTIQICRAMENARSQGKMFGPSEVDQVHQHNNVLIRMRTRTGIRAAAATAVEKAQNTVEKYVQLETVLAEIVENAVTGLQFAEVIRIQNRRKK
jgi:hypothetical protein